MATSIGSTKINASGPLDRYLETASKDKPAASGFSFSDYQVNPLQSYLDNPFTGIRRPLLKTTKPPRGRTMRNSDPFDFFGTLFTQPATAELNPMSMLNQTV